MKKGKTIKNIYIDMTSYRFEEQLDAIKDSYNSMLNENSKLHKKLAEFRKDDEISKLDDELKDTREHSLLILSDKELEQCRAFREKHYAKCHNGNNYIYDLTGTGLGTIIKIKCPKCGEEVDITDMETW